MKLSVVVPVYNGKKYFNTSLRSLIDQTEQDFEVVVVDDGSTDGSADAAETMLAGSGLRYQVLTRKNGGESAARNQGLEAAKEEFVLFLDCDDKVSTLLVEKVYALKDKEQADVICWDRKDVQEQEITAEETVGTKCFSMNGIEVLQSMLPEERLKICTGSAAYRKAFLKEFDLRYTEGCINGADQEFQYKVLAKAEHVIYLNETMMFYVHREGSISNSFALQRFQAIAAIQRAAAYMEQSDNDQMKELAGQLKQQKVVENYFYNLQGCLAHSHKAEIRQLLTKIEERYPGLNEQVRKQMESYSGKDRKLQWKIRFFLFSPALYQRVSKLTEVAQ